MKIQEAVETCVTKKYADFRGEATRSEFWYFYLFVVIVDVLLDVVDVRLQVLFGLAMFVPLLAAAARRLHDTSRSAWWLLVGIVPVVGTVILIVFAAQPGRTPTTPI